MRVMSIETVKVLSLWLSKHYDIRAPEPLSSPLVIAPTRQLGATPSTILSTADALVYLTSFAYGTRTGTSNLTQSTTTDATLPLRLLLTTNLTPALKRLFELRLLLLMKQIIPIIDFTQPTDYKGLYSSYYYYTTTTTNTKRGPGQVDKLLRQGRYKTTDLKSCFGDLILNWLTPLGTIFLSKLHSISFWPCRQRASNLYYLPNPPRLLLLSSLLTSLPVINQVQCP